ncbi:Protoporphyrinogen oxidase [Aquisphaera giovannonii]|uniref:Coproporphyrinogen III oxidase n=1 Tax=Aquisphaera giovannonii TaxID=406548 RepID=A0A5B9VZ35_9BACT|nr:Protoporphyrinogen oxidase [Aquisphaera giovannonii]
MAVIGGGISGLAAARRLVDTVPRVDVHVLEAGERAGGVLGTVRDRGFLIEESADSFLTATPHAVDLCRRVGLEGEVIPTDPSHRRAFVVSEGRLVPLPDGLMVMAPTRLWPMVTTPILGPFSKLRMGMELLVGRSDLADESLAGFARRRFGKGAYERLIQPLVGGMYTGDPERLSAEATMPRFREMERNHGSLIRASLRERAERARRERDTTGAGPADGTAGKAAGSGARYGMFAGLRDGMGSLVEATIRSLPPNAVRCGAAVRGLARLPGGGWRVSVADSGDFLADAVVVATAARDAARLLTGIDPDLGAELGRIRSTSCAIVSLAYSRDQIEHRLDGFGFVVPEVEKLQVLSATFSSVKFAGRAPADMVLLRAFLGGAFRAATLDRPDPEIIATAAAELGRLLGIRGEPSLTRIRRWPGVMPQYELGHIDLVRSIEDRIRAIPGLALAGNAYHGVGVPQCIKSGEEAAETIAEYLSGVEKAASGT